MNNLQRESLDKHITGNYGEDQFKETHICVICDCEFDGYGHNAEPVKKGICCSDCNTFKVIPKRIKLVIDRK